MIEKDITIINKLGLHARAAAKFVQTASRFASKVEVNNDTKTINAKSIMGVMMLAAGQGTVLKIIVNGEDEVAAMNALEELINNRFGEES
ncbi:MAG: HPr family phosphocarrier protein [Gammaproteobacteria bacterium]